MLKPLLYRGTLGLDRILTRTPSFGRFKPPRGGFSAWKQWQEGRLEGGELVKRQESGPCPPDSITSLAGMRQNDHQPWPVFWVRADDARLVGRMLHWRNRDDLLCSEGVFHMVQRRRLSEDRFFAQIFVPPPIKIDGAWTSISSNWADCRNYYHWILDGLTRLQIRELLPEETRILLPPSVPAYAEETLEMLGLSHLVLNAPSPCIQPERYYFCSPSSMTGVWNPMGYRWLREKFAPFCQVAAKGMPIFLTRRGATRLPDKLAEIERIFASSGFKLVDCGMLTVKEQVRLASEAPAIAGLHGAAMTNILWAKPGTPVLEIFQQEYLNACYEQIAFHGQLNYTHHILDVSGPASLLNDWAGEFGAGSTAATVPDPVARSPRVATCTPVAFEADAQFFGRDTGLLCRGFQRAGANCVVVMPGVPADEDAPDLVRCRDGDLSDAGWWRSRELDLVVLYAWCDPVYRPVADAIREAGITLIQGIDTGGLHTPYGNFRKWWSCFTAMASVPQPLSSSLRTYGKAIRDLIPALFDSKRLDMMNRCDHLATVSPPAAGFIRDYATALGHAEIASKIIVVPHSVAEIMKPSGEKFSKVLVVGRWKRDDRGQKDPELTLAVLSIFLQKMPDWTAEVVGCGSHELESMTRGWRPEVKARLILTEAIPRENLVGRYQESKIVLCCSRYESFHISSAEALCCGCSVVVAEHPLLSSTGWFTTRHSGTLAAKRTPDTLGKALLDEAMAWEEGNRDAMAISSAWTPTLHARHVAADILAVSVAKTFARHAVLTEVSGRSIASAGG